MKSEDGCSDTPAGAGVNPFDSPVDMNHNGIPDYLETKAAVPKQKIEKPEYDLVNKFLIRDMIFSDGNSYTAQISAWRDEPRAETEARKLREMDYNAFAARVFIAKWDQTWYRV